MDNNKKGFTLVVILTILLIIGIVGYFMFRMSSTSGVVFAEHELNKGPKLDEAVVVQFNGRIRRYRNENYSKTTRKNRFANSEGDYFNEIKDFWKMMGRETARPVFINYDKKVMLLKDYSSGNVNFDLWRYDLNTKEKSKLSGTYSDGDCGEVINWVEEEGVIYAANVEDISSILFVEKYCQIDQKSGKVSKTLSVPRETIEFSIDRLDRKSNRMLVGNRVLDLNNLEFEASGLEGFKKLQFISNDEFINGKAIMRVGNGEFVVYNIRNNNISEVIKLEKKTDSQLDFVDVSPTFDYALFEYFIRDSSRSGGGNGYSCYILLNLHNHEISEFCSIDLSKNEQRLKSFYGWII